MNRDHRHSAQALQGQIREKAALLSSALKLAENAHAKDKAVVTARGKIQAAVAALQAASQAYAAARRDHRQATQDLAAALKKYLPKYLPKGFLSEL